MVVDQGADKVGDVVDGVQPGQGVIVDNAGDAAVGVLNADPVKGVVDQVDNVAEGLPVADIAGGALNGVIGGAGTPPLPSLPVPGLPVGAPPLPSLPTNGLPIPPLPTNALPPLPIPTNVVAGVIPTPAIPHIF